MEWLPPPYVGCGGSNFHRRHFRKYLDTTPVLIGFGKDDRCHPFPMKKRLGAFHKGIPKLGTGYWIAMTRKRAGLAARFPVLDRGKSDI